MHWGPAMPSLLIFFCVFSGTALLAIADPVPTAIFTDPPPDATHPAAMRVLHIPSHGVLINGLINSPSGAGPHPTFVICHGLPGNEINVDDAEAVLTYLRDSKNAAEMGIDTKRLGIAGHSMGGWVTAHTAAQDHGLIGAALISAGDIGRVEEWGRKKALAFMADDMEALAGVTPENMVDEIHVHAQEFALKNAANGLARIPFCAEMWAIVANDLPARRRSWPALPCWKMRLTGNQNA